MLFLKLFIICFLVRIFDFKLSVRDLNDSRICSKKLSLGFTLLQLFQKTFGLSTFSFRLLPLIIFKNCPSPAISIQLETLQYCALVRCLSFLVIYLHPLYLQKLLSTASFFRFFNPLIQRPNFCLIHMFIVFCTSTSWNTVILSSSTGHAIICDNCLWKQFPSPFQIPPQILVKHNSYSQLYLYSSLYSSSKSSVNIQ